MYIEDDFFIYLRKDAWYMKTKSGFFIKELKGDTFTPISILQKISGDKKFLLESSHKYHDSGRYSIIGSDPAFELISTGDSNEILYRNGEKKVLQGNPLELIKTLLPKMDEAPFPFIGGAVGYVGYDIIRQFEVIGEEFPNGLQMPDVHLMFYEEVIVFDHLEEKITICGIPFLEESDIEKRIRQKN